jgi:hypothetical protein
MACGSDIFIVRQTYLYTMNYLGTQQADASCEHPCVPYLFFMGIEMCEQGKLFLTRWG